jgi:hypothetical protein
VANPFSEMTHTPTEEEKGEMRTFSGIAKLNSCLEHPVEAK